MDSGFNTLLIVGIIILGVTLIIFITAKIELKKIPEKLNKTLKDNQVISN